MPSRLGDRLGGFFHRLSHKGKAKGDQAPEGSGFQVDNRGRRPTAASAESPPEGWSTSPTQLRSPATDRSGSPDEALRSLQTAYFGGDAPISPIEGKSLRVLNPDRPSSPKHPDCLTPGKGEPPKAKLTPDLTFEDIARPRPQRPRGPRPPPPPAPSAGGGYYGLDEYGI